MPGFTARQRFRQDVPRLLHQLHRKLFERLELAVQLEAEIIQRSLQHERAMLSARIVSQLGLATCRIPSDQVHRDLRPFDRGPWYSGTIGEVTQVACNGAPASGHTRL